MLSMANIWHFASRSHFASVRISLLAVPNVRISCFLSHLRQATIERLCTSIPQQCSHVTFMRIPSISYDAVSSIMSHFTIRPFEHSSEQSVVRKRRSDQFTSELESQKLFDLATSVFIIPWQGRSHSSWCPKVWGYYESKKSSQKRRLIG